PHSQLHPLSLHDALPILARAQEEAAGTTSDVKDDVKRVDVSIIAGAGVSMGKFGVEARYDGGVKDLDKDHALGDALTIKSRTIRDRKSTRLNSSHRTISY